MKIYRKCVKMRLGVKVFLSDHLVRSIDDHYNYTRDVVNFICGKTYR